MPFQTTKRNQYIAPEGFALGVSIDNGATFEDLGVFEAGLTITHNFDKLEQESGNAGKLKARVKNETLAVAPSLLWTWDLQALAKASGGLFTFVDVPGTPVAGADQVIASGWAKNIFIPFTNQNGDGTAPTVNSVTGSVDNALTELTEYIIIQQGSEWGIILLDAVTTLAQDVTINTDYTPSASTKLTSGKVSTTLERVILRLRRYTDDALTVFDIETFMYGVDIDAGLQFNFDGANSDSAVMGVQVAFTANLDSSQPDGAQLLSMLIANTAKISA